MTEDEWEKLKEKEKAKLKESADMIAERLVDGLLAELEVDGALREVSPEELLELAEKTFPKKVIKELLDEWLLALDLSVRETLRRRIRRRVET